MNKKQLTVATALILLITFRVFAETKTYKVDLDGDGKKEVITVEDIFDPKIGIVVESVITVSSSDKIKLGNFSMPERFDKIDFISFNKDNSRQIAAWSNSGMHYTNLAIYGFRNGKLYSIFKNGSACLIEADFKAAKPLVKVGRANWEQKGWSYGTGEPLWEVYQWDGKELKFNRELSTMGQISEDTEVQRYVDKVISKTKK